MATYYKLICYDEDGTTPLAEFSTDPAHARPYLREPENLVGQELDFAAGSARIGGVSIEIVDVAPAGDNDGGAVTAILPTISKGTRAQLLKSIDGAPYANVIRGAFDSVSLHDSYSSYVVRLRDERELERRIRAFTRCTTSSVVPRGVVGGFGQQPGGGWLAPPVTPLVGTLGQFTPVGLTNPKHRITLPSMSRDGKGRAIVTDALVSRIITDKQRAQFVLESHRPDPFTFFSGGAIGYLAPRVRLLWRPAASSGAVTASAAMDTFTQTAHGLTVGDVVAFYTLTGGVGVFPGRKYYVIATPTANTFQVSKSDGGAALDVMSDLTAGTLYRVIDPLGGFLLQAILGTTIGVYRDRECTVLTHLDFDWPLGSAPPANGTQLNFIVGYNGPASEDYPFHFEGTFGGLLAAIYDGVVSDVEDGPLVRYDPVAVAALNEPVRARVTKALDDQDGVWKWVQENIYAPLS